MTDGFTAYDEGEVLIQDGLEYKVTDVKKVQDDQKKDEYFY